MRVLSILLALSLAAPAAVAETYTAEELAARAVERRAVEAVIWGMPAVNADLMLQAALGIGMGENEVVIWSRPVDWRNQTLTPNPDAIYLMPFVNTREGPVVIDVPPAGEDGSFTANIDDVWQMPLEDAGPAGADGGAGGKYLILPPGYDGEVPEGHIVLRSPTFRGYALFRSTLRSHDEADIAAAVAYGKRLQIYPLKDAASPPPTRFTDAAGVFFDATIPYDIRFLEALHRVVQHEPWLERDKAMIDPLRTLGIEKGAPFAPDAGTKALLEAGIAEARAWLDMRYEAAFVPFAPGSRWSLPVDRQFIADSEAGYVDPDHYSIDARGVAYSFAFIGIKRLGNGQTYLLSIADSNGDALDGGSRYRLRIPPDVPVAQYWSVTAYDRETHALIKGVPHASRASTNANLETNADGSVDVVFGPEPPEGGDANWIPTDPEGEFELMFRFYRPEPALFEKTWVLPDVEKLN